ncbi:gamma-glutamylcyclotransferase [Paenibacillus antri]|uniref:Gamma-glutamylcyclotransferase family protein n=1 Tax=Paenibacillus antri TaxID=2582848 RepID=A0A5R9GE74_9BACL|nr:gamma-glutamylcyclotransferase [Paenibacillus antri]TLS50953.1 gamma-glutamylcyclotransferase [Paenibacillus antri]
MESAGGRERIGIAGRGMIRLEYERAGELRMRQSEGILVFVYGTLLQGEANDRWLRDARRVAPEAVAPGTLYDTGRGYPAMTTAGRESESTVLGELYAIDEQTLQALDELEDFYGSGDPRNEYERVRSVVRTEHGASEAWTYVYERVPTGCTHIPTGDWRRYRRELQERPLRDR